MKLCLCVYITKQSLVIKGKKDFRDYSKYSSMICGKSFMVFLALSILG